MTKLLTMLMAAGVGLGVNGAIAQNVTSEGDRAQGQKQITGKISNRVRRSRKMVRVNAAIRITTT